MFQISHNERDVGSGTNFHTSRQVPRTGHRRAADSALVGRFNLRVRREPTAEQHCPCSSPQQQRPAYAQTRNGYRTVRAPVFAIDLIAPRTTALPHDKSSYCCVSNDPRTTANPLGAAKIHLMCSHGTTRVIPRARVVYRSSSSAPTAACSRQVTRPTPGSTTGAVCFDLVRCAQHDDADRQVRTASPLAAGAHGRPGARWSPGASLPGSGATPGPAPGDCPPGSAGCRRCPA